MEEVLVGFEVAKLAKDRGFNPYGDDVKYAVVDNRNGFHTEHSFYRTLDGVSELYRNVGTNSSDFFGVLESYKDGDDKIHAAPTQGQLQKWLREEKGQYVEPYSKVYAIDVFSKFRKYHCYLNDEDMAHTDTSTVEGTGMFETYEGALEVGLLQALTLLF